MTSPSASRNDGALKLVDTLRQALLEMSQAHGNPSWFTKGKEGAEAQFRLWRGKGAEAVTALESLLSESNAIQSGPFAGLPKPHKVPEGYVLVDEQSFKIILGVLTEEQTKEITRKEGERLMETQRRISERITLEDRAAGRDNPAQRGT